MAGAVLYVANNGTVREIVGLVKVEDRTKAVEAGFLKSEEAKALVGLFLNDQYIKSLAKQSAKVANKETQRAAVLGAGIMGGGIAYQ